MANEKVKLAELVSTAVSESLVEAIKLAKPKYKELDNVELAAALGLTEFQFTHLKDKVLGRLVAKKLENEVKHTLVHGNSIEVPHQFNVFVHASSVRKNEDGEPSKKVSVQTRAQLKTELNKLKEDKRHGNNKEQRKGRKRRK